MSLTLPILDFEPMLSVVGNNAWSARAGSYVFVLTYRDERGWTASWSRTDGKPQSCTSERRIGPFLSRAQCLTALESKAHDLLAT